VLSKQSIETKLLTETAYVSVYSEKDITWLGGIPRNETPHLAGGLSLFAGRDVTMTGVVGFSNGSDSGICRSNGFLSIAANLPSPYADPNASRTGTGTVTITSDGGQRSSITLDRDLEIGNVADGWWRYDGNAGYGSVPANWRQNVVLDADLVSARSVIINTYRADGLYGDGGLYGNPALRPTITFTGTIETVGDGRFGYPGDVTQSYRGNLIFDPRHGSNDIVFNSTFNVPFYTHSTRSRGKIGRPSSIAGRGTARFIEGDYDGSVARLAGYASFGEVASGVAIAENKMVHLITGPTDADDYSRRYGEEIANLRVVNPQIHGGLRTGDTLAAIGNGQITGNINPNVGTEPIDYGLASGFVPGRTGYFIDASYHPIQVTTAPAVVSIDLSHRSATYTYGSPDWIIKVNNLYPGDQISPVVSLNGSGTGTALTALATAEYGLPVRTGVGSHGYTITGLSGPNASNYTLDLTTPRTGTVTINQRQLAMTARSVTQEVELRRQQHWKVPGANRERTYAAALLAAPKP
jgi:hypothetical protein